VTGLVPNQAPQAPPLQLAAVVGAVTSALTVKDQL
jgi:hypothetical protein